MPTPRALVVDDAPENRLLVSALLARQGFDVAQAEDGDAAVKAAASVPLDLIVLDGAELCRRVRECTDAHVLMLKKPFSDAELVGRAKAVLGRTARTPDTTSVRTVGTLTVDAAGREAKLGGAVLDLTRAEFDLLDTLSAEPGVVFSRAQLLERVWGENRFGDDHLVDVHISNLRRKLPDLIRTVRGIGYRIAL